jgi:hypothetical protein
MFSITDETCRRFTLAEILILAAMNVRTAGIRLEGHVGSESVAAQSVSASHFVRTTVRQPVQA